MTNILNSLKGGLLLLVFLAVLPCIQIRGQVTVDDYPGIPLIIYNNLRQDSMKAIHYDQMQNMGVYGVLVSDVQFDTAGNGRLGLYEEHGLKVLPYQVWRTPNDIFKYTDSHYSVWEAEGTDYIDTTNGKATLYRSGHTIIDEGDTTSVKTDTTVTAGETLIWGPGYTQDALYRFATAVGDTIVDYDIEYNMKIDTTSSLPPGYLEDVVCTLLVTNIATDLGTPEDTVMFKEVRVSRFSGWDTWTVIDTSYDLIDDQSSPEFGAGMNQPETDWQPSAYFVQFKVIWEGLDYLDLYIDKIRVYDENGLGIVTDENIQSFIVDQVTQQTDTTIIGWYALDEPITIDNYEPIRVVSNIIADVSGTDVQLWAGISRTWNGTYGYPPLGGTFTLFPPLEFRSRTKLENVHLNAYMYHNPYNGTVGTPGYDAEWLTKNINCVANLNLARLNDFDTSFAYSTQSGGFYQIDDDCNVNATGIIPSSAQINYHTNLGLLYGAKELWLDPFFSAVAHSETCNKSFYSTKGLINANDDTTANYNFFRFTLVPRLNSWFGKTLKRIHQSEQYTEKQLPVTTPSHWVESISYTDGDGAQPPDFVDFGFFRQSYSATGDMPYFMIVSRWYSTALQGDSLTIHINKSGEEYTNWNVTNFIDSTMETIVYEGDINMPHIAGESRLFKVAPVVTDGGRLIADEEIGNETLNDDMVIENGATLSISGDYYVDADIIVKDGGRIVNTGNGKITFYNDHKLILQGNSTLSGLSQDKLVLDFVSPSENNGIIADSGLVIIISNCEIKNAGTGITVSSFSSLPPESDDFRFRVDSVDFIDCEEFSINITGQYVNKAMIENSSFTGSAYGVSAVNLDETVIFNNYFTNTEMGIRLINITKADVIGNTITSNQYSMQGIFFDNSGGNLRTNLVQGHTNGIHLGNSSPDIGNNRIYDNKYHGIYIGIGSLPNMLGGRWVGDPPVFYATSGYNKIYENGGWHESNPPPNNDGSEIFINYANVLTRQGL